MKYEGSEDNVEEEIKKRDGSEEEQRIIVEGEKKFETNRELCKADRAWQKTERERARGRRYSDRKQASSETDLGDRAIVELRCLSSQSCARKQQGKPVKRRAIRDRSPGLSDCECTVYARRVHDALTVRCLVRRALRKTRNDARTSGVELPSRVLENPSGTS